MKYSRREVRGKAHALPRLKFENQSLTSFSGLVVFQQFFAVLGLKARLARCFAHQAAGKVFGRATLFLQLVLHLLLGYRELRDSRYYRDDPLVKRLLGLRRLPDVATLSRMRKEADAKGVENLRQLLRELLFHRLADLRLSRITLDFDGSVLSTTRRAEATAVGFNKKKKGARSYYPLFCTIAQTSQVLDFLHRSGNVHDSHGAREFILACIQAVRQALPGVVIEVRMDSAFFSDEIVMALDEARIEFTVTVPYERFMELKGKIEGRKRWQRFGNEVSYFEEHWKPKVWSRRFRFLFIRTRTKRQQKRPIQLDLFLPYEYGYDSKVVVTNKTISPKKVVAFHEGRGSQEGIFGELKSHCQMGYVRVRKWLGNQTYLLAGLLAHNLLRELVIVFDRLAAPEPSSFEYWLHAVNKFTVNGQRDIVTRAGDVVCAIDILAPEGLSFTQTDQYDPNPWPQITMREWHLTATTPSRAKTAEFVAVYRPHRAAPKGDPAVPRGAELKRIEGGYVLTAELCDGRVTALVPTDDAATLSAEGLTATGTILIRRQRADGTVETVDLGKQDAPSR